MISDKEFACIMLCVLLGALLVGGLLSIDSMVIEEFACVRVVSIVLFVVLLVAECSVDADTLQVTTLSQPSQISPSKIQCTRKCVMLRFGGNNRYYQTVNTVTGHHYG